MAARPPLIFVHYPKAAGTALRRQFEAALGPAFLRDYDHRPLGPHATAIVDSIDSNVACVFGHFKPGRYDRIEPAIRATILRHPIDALVSRYFYWRAEPPHGNSIHDRFVAERPDIEAFVAYPEFRNHMSGVYFGGYDMRRFDFIGFYDSLATDAAILGRLAGIDVSATYRDNVTVGGDDERRNILNDRAILGRLADHLRDDIAFYEKQRERRRSVS